MSPKVMLIYGLRLLSVCYLGLAGLSSIKTIKRVLGIKLWIWITLGREGGALTYMNVLGLI